jgi:hypothetical protein
MANLKLIGKEIRCIMPPIRGREKHPGLNSFHIRED